MVDQDDIEIEPDPFGEDQLPPMELPHTNSSVRDVIFRNKRYYTKDEEVFHLGSERFNMGSLYESDKNKNICDESNNGELIKYP